MDIISFATNRAAEKQGVWQDIGAGASLKVARIGNILYQQMLQEELDPYKANLRAGTLDKKIADKIYLRTLSKTVLLDWKGIEERGAASEYSIEKAYQFLEEYPDFRRLVEHIAEDIQTFQVELEEDAAKN